MHELNVCAGAAKIPQAAGHGVQAGADQGRVDQCREGGARRSPLWGGGGGIGLGGGWRW